MAKKVKAGTPVVYWHEKPSDNWPGGLDWQGPGYYEVITDTEDDHTQAKFGKKLQFELNKQNPEGEPADPENNEGHFVYAGSEDDEE